MIYNNKKAVTVVTGQLLCRIFMARSLPLSIRITFSLLSPEVLEWWHCKSGPHNKSSHFSWHISRCQCLASYCFFCPPRNATTCYANLYKDSRSKKIAQCWHVSLSLYCVCPSYVKGCWQVVKLFFREFFCLAVQLAECAVAHWRVTAAKWSFLLCWNVLCVV